MHGLRHVRLTVSLADDLARFGPSKGLEEIRRRALRNAHRTRAWHLAARFFRHSRHLRDRIDQLLSYEPLWVIARVVELIDTIGWGRLARELANTRVQKEPDRVPQV